MVYQEGSGMIMDDIWDDIWDDEWDDVWDDMCMDNIGQPSSWVPKGLPSP